MDPRRSTALVVLAGAFLVGPRPMLAAPVPADLVLSPRDTVLHGRTARQRLILSGTVDGRAVDLTREARFRTLTPAVVEVTAEGVVTPRGRGRGTILATARGREA